MNGLNSFTGSVTLTASSVTNEGSSFSANPISLTNTKTAGITTKTIAAFKTNAISGQSAHEVAVDSSDAVEHDGIDRVAAGAGSAWSLKIAAEAASGLWAHMAAVLSVGLLRGFGLRQRRGYQHRSTQHQHNAGNVHSDHIWHRDIGLNHRDAHRDGDADRAVTA